MKLIEVLRSSRSAEAVIEGGTVVVEKALNIDGGILGHWYDIQQPGQRHHNFVFDWEEIIDDLCYILDVEAEALDWHASEKEVNLVDCRCKDCKAFCLEHGIIPDWLPLHEALWHRAAWWVRDVRWWCWTRWLWIKEWKYRRQVREEYDEEQRLEARCVHWEEQKNIHRDDIELLP